jgi:hypothetical protein
MWMGIIEEAVAAPCYADQSQISLDKFYVWWVTYPPQYQKNIIPSMMVINPSDVQTRSKNPSYRTVDWVGMHPV